MVYQNIIIKDGTLYFLTMDSTDVDFFRVLTHGEAADERVTWILRRTIANGVVVSYGTQCTLTASVFAGILAFLVHTGPALFAVRVDEALGSAAGWSSKVSREAGAGSLLTKFAANAVRSAGWGFARFHTFYHHVRWSLINCILEEFLFKTGWSCRLHSLRIGLQRVNGSPSWFSTQLHVGMWFTTVHSAFWPQIPVQGFTHLLLEQALS